MKKVYGAVMVVDGLVDIFEKYKLDEYLTAIGLSVDPRFRGQSIGFELLKARYILILTSYN